MEDKAIVDLYWERSDDAISETQKKYGKYCHYIAFNILYSDLDAEECVNDTYVNAWNSMPPHKPEHLSTFLGKITRNLALDRYRYNNVHKRSAYAEVILSEVREFVPEPADDKSMTDRIALKDAINTFLTSLTLKERILFVRRYWYVSQIKEIAHDYDMSVSNVKVTLMRTRKKFKAYLEKEGIEI